MRVVAGVVDSHPDTDACPETPSREGSEEFDRAYRAWYPAVVEFCRRFLNGQGDPEAVAQEVFIRAWSTPDRFRGTRFRAWVFTIARRLCIDVCRHGAVEHAYATSTENVGLPTLDGDELLESADDQRLVRRALASLSPGYRRLMTLHYLNGWSYGDIADAENLTVEAVRARLRRARTAFRHTYARVTAAGKGFALVRWYRWLRNRAARSSPRFDQALASWLHVCISADVLVGSVVTAMAVGGPTLATEWAHIAVPVAPPEAGAPAADKARDHRGPVTQASRSELPTTPATPEGRSGPSELDAAMVLFHGEPTTFSDFTPSPQYETDGTIFATGRDRWGCVTPCGAVFRSTDRGATWKRLPSVGFMNSRLLVPPSYPADPRLFAIGTGMLRVSFDGGASFLPVLSVPADSTIAAAISPDFARDGWILVDKGLDYYDRSQPAIAITDATMPPTATEPAFSPAYADDHTVFAGIRWNRDPTSVVRCVGGRCETVATLPSRSASTVVVSPTFSGRGPVAVFGERDLFVSPDGALGYDYVSPSLPLGGLVEDAAFDRHARLFVALFHGTDIPWRGGLVASDDGGRSWRILGGRTALAKGVGAVDVLPDGRILAGIHDMTGGGMLCSVDGGTTWQPTCRP
jgi:RNA polymerase sigma-70 factor (ECF subfamily)